MLKYYIQLMKPGIIIVNLISVLSGFFFASAQYNNINLYSLFFVLCATACIIASSCILNNIIDIDIDRIMYRTKKRVLVKSLLSTLHAKIYSMLLFLCSMWIFIFKINLLCFWLSIFGFFIYVVLYSLYIKRISKHSILVGSLSGAIPPIIGYCAVTNYVDWNSFLLFVTLCIWQIPHSYAILVTYCKEYQLANIPTIVSKNGLLKTIQLIMCYIFLFYICIILFYLFKFINLFCFIVLSILNIIWLIVSVFYYFFNHVVLFARLLFFLSIIIIFVFNCTLIVYYFNNIV